MAEYKPSFPYQSKVNSSTVVNNDAQIVSLQADQSNTMGTSSQSQIGATIGGVGNVIKDVLIDYNPIAQMVTTVLGGGLATYQDLVTNEDFVCSLALLANGMMCGSGLPECPSPKNIMAIRQEGNSWIADCGCSDNSGDDQNNIPDPDDPDILSIQLGSVKCLQKAKSEALKKCITKLFPLNLRQDTNVPWDEYADIIQKEIEGILNNPELTPDEKYQQIEQLILMLNNIISQNGWDVDYPDQTTNLGTTTATYLIRFRDCAANINNNCQLNSTPTFFALKLLLKGMTRKPEKKCPEGQSLNDYCFCVCPSGTEECGADNTCMMCPEGSNLIMRSGLFKDYCECSCPSGTVESYICDPNAFPIPAEKGGPTPKEYRARCYACLPPCPEGMTRPRGSRDCKCRKNKGSWLFPDFEYVDNSGCENASGQGWRLEGYKPNPKKNCDCDCYEKGYDIYLCPETSGVHGQGVTYVQICHTRCPFKTEFDCETRSCVCADLWGGPCPSGTVPSSGDPCTCIPVSSGSYSYSSLTIAELAKIAANFGYNFNTNLELL